MWNGTFTRGYQTTVRWECDAKGHLAASIVSDSAKIAVSANGLRKLNAYFEQLLWPQLR